jgi:tetratricopeptide (TPR) repeat protein
MKRRITVPAFLIAIVVALPIPAWAQALTYDEAVRLYQAGKVDEAIAGVQAILAKSTVNVNRFVNTTATSVTTVALPQQISEWIDGAVRGRRQQDLEAALMLQTEAVFAAQADADATASVFLAFTSTLRQLAAIRRLHDALIVIVDQEDRFLRCWYLLWESHAQATGTGQGAADADYLERALKRFPQDGEVLLAAGSRAEARWWRADGNPLRDPGARPDAGATWLRDAADWLRKSLTANPGLQEARLRLGRVLFLLGDVDSSMTALDAVRSSDADAAWLYVADLFQGDLLEQRGDVAGAARAFASAARRVPNAQSARIAAAHLAHASGDRAAATEEIGRAFDSRVDAADPWWWYTRGIAWRFDNYLKAATAMVRR